MWAFRAFLAQIPNINRGGCAIAALAMYRYAKRLGLNAQIMYLYQIKEDYNTNCLAVDGICDPSNCMHAVCVMDNNSWDATKYVPVHVYGYRHFVPEELVKKSIITGTWNPEFDTKKYLPEIEAVLGEKLINN